MALYRDAHTAINQYKNECIRYNQAVDRQRKIICSVALLCLLFKKTKKRYRRKRFWTSELCEGRLDYGAFYSVYPCLTQNPDLFRNYCRMTSGQFEDLLMLLQPHIIKFRWIREPILPRERLLMTLRYLASGDSQISMSYEFGLGKTTVCHIIYETCVALWTTLRPRVLPVPTVETWSRIAREFEERWNFPHCIGAIDGKHVNIKAPAHSGSSFYNYKGTHSLVLLAICDAQYKFSLLDVGAEGRQSDGGVFRKSALGQAFLNKEANVPAPSALCDGGPVLPYTLVGDAAFPLSEFLMRPYPDKTGITREQKTFNYRLSRARRMIESTFGIMVSQWRIFSGPINAQENTAHKIIEACVCLHNFIRESNIVNNIDEQSSGFDNHEDTRIEGTGMRNMTQAGSNTHSRHAAQIRQKFAEYFTDIGAVEWQWERI